MKRSGAVAIGVLFACACSRGSLLAIDRATGADAKIGASAEDARDSAPTVICPSPVAPAGNSNMTVAVGSTNRSYVLHIPTTYTGKKPVPLIFDFHANNGSGRSQSSTSPYPSMTDPEGVVMAFPSGVLGPAGTAWNLGPCCVSDVDDLAFTRAMIEQIRSTVCIDPKRIYAVGHITGGGMAYMLACRASETIAAVAASAWDLLQDDVADCKPNRPITVVSFRSVGDTLIPYAGGYSSVVPGMPITFLGAVATFQTWAQINGCIGSPSREDSDGCSTYSNCRGGVRVVLCTKQSSLSDVSDPGIAWPLLKESPLP